MQGVIFGLAGGATGGGGGGGGGGAGGAGGGGGDCSGVVCDVGSIIITVLLVGFGLVVVLLLLWTQWDALKSKRRTRALEAEARRAGGDWHPQVLYPRVHRCFNFVQESWKRNNLEVSRPYVSDALYERHRLQLEGLARQQRRNRIEDLWLKNLRLVHMHNVPDDSEDSFVVEVSCSARDWMEDTFTGEVINGNRNTATSFTQYWSFVRGGDGNWVLDEIQQHTEGGYHERRESVNADAAVEHPRAEAHTPVS